MSKLLLWMQLVILKQFKKKIINLGKAMNKFESGCTKTSVYAVTGHKVDLSTELDLMRDVLVGIEMEIKRVEEARKC